LAHGNTWWHTATPGGAPPGGVGPLSGSRRFWGRQSPYGLPPPQKRISGNGCLPLAYSRTIYTENVTAPEHRLFSYITQNWRGKPLQSFQTIVNLIAATTTKTGLKVHAELNTETYQPGIRISDEELAQVNIRRDKFHGDWNYEIQPLNPLH